MRHACALTLLLLAPCGPAAAQDAWPFEVRDAPPAALKRQFDGLLLDCVKQTTRFLELGRVPRGSVVPVKLVSDDPEVLFGSYGRVTDPQTIDLGDIGRLPVRTRAGGVPDWAPTQCSILGHELAEARDKVVRRQWFLDHPERDPFTASHELGIAWENRLRMSLGQSQCRHKVIRGNEAGAVPHAAHTDAATRYGGHSVRTHWIGTDSLSFSYEAGEDRVCGQSDLATG